MLSRQALNRALLSRQLLLGRPELPSAPDGRRAAVIGAVEQLIGLQAQAPFPPYYGLWSRLADFRPDDLAELILSWQVVRIALMRGTIHLVSARDCLLLRPLIQPVLDRGLAAGFGKQLGGLDTAELAAAGRALRTFCNEEGGELFDLRKTASGCSPGTASSREPCWSADSSPACGRSSGHPRRRR